MSPKSQFSLGEPPSASPLSGGSSPWNESNSSSTDGSSPGSRTCVYSDWEVDRGLNGNSSKEGRVILRMEVSHPEHSYLIGVGGEKVNEMKAAGSCLIHYPDGKDSNNSNADSGRHYPSLHSNEVTIRGKLPNAYLGYAKVRDSIRFNLVYTVSPASRIYELDTDISSRIVSFQQLFSVDVSFKVENGLIRQVHVRGPQTLQTLLGAERVFLYFHRSLSGLLTQMEVTQSLCIHPHNQSAMMNLCDGEKWLKMVAQGLGVSIHFPDSRTGDKQTVTLRGTISACAAGWIIIMSMLPITLRVFIGHDTDFRRSSLARTISEEYQVNFLPPRRERRPADRQYVELQSFEGNMGNIIKAFKELMGSSAAVPKHILTASDKLLQLGLGAAVELSNPSYLKRYGGIPSKSTQPLMPVPMPSWPFPMPVMPMNPFNPLIPPYMPFPFSPGTHDGINAPKPVDIPSTRRCCCHPDLVKPTGGPSVWKEIWEIWEKEIELQKKRVPVPKNRNGEKCVCCLAPSRSDQRTLQKDKHDNIEIWRNKVNRVVGPRLDEPSLPGDDYSKYVGIAKKIVSYRPPVNAEELSWTDWTRYDTYMSGSRSSSPVSPSTSDPWYCGKE